MKTTLYAYQARRGWIVIKETEDNGIYEAKQIAGPFRSKSKALQTVKDMAQARRDDYLKRTGRPWSSTYSQENGLGDFILMGIGLVTVIGVGYFAYKFYESEQTYQATLPPGVPVASPGYQAWLQTPAGQATLA